MDTIKSKMSTNSCVKWILSRVNTNIFAWIKPVVATLVCLVLLNFYVHWRIRVWTERSSRFAPSVDRHFEAREEEREKQKHEWDKQSNLNITIKLDVYVKLWQQHVQEVALLDTNLEKEIERYCKDKKKFNLPLRSKTVFPLNSSDIFNCSLALLNKYVDKMRSNALNKPATAYAALSNDKYKNATGNKDYNKKSDYIDLIDTNSHVKSVYVDFIPNVMKGHFKQPYLLDGDDGVIETNQKEHPSKIEGEISEFSNVISSDDKFYNNTDYDENYNGEELTEMGAILKTDTSGFPIFLHVVRGFTFIDKTGTCYTNNLHIIPNQCESPNMESTDVKNPVKFDEVFSIAQVDFVSRISLHQSISRLAPFVTFLRFNDKITIHVSDKQKDAIMPYLQFIGIDSKRVISGNIHAKLAYLPQGSGCQHTNLLPTMILDNVYTSYLNKINLPDTFQQVGHLILLRDSKLHQMTDFLSLRSNLQDIALDIGLEYFEHDEAYNAPLLYTMDLFKHARLVIGHSESESFSHIMHCERGTFVIEISCRNFAINVAEFAWKKQLRHNGIIIDCKPNVASTERLQSFIIDAFLTRPMMEMD